MKSAPAFSLALSRVMVAILFSLSRRSHGGALPAAAVLSRMMKLPSKAPVIRFPAAENPISSQGDFFHFFYLSLL